MLEEKKTITIGVDIGGSHITASIIDLESYCTVPHTHFRNHVDTYGSAEAILDVWVETIRSVLSCINDQGNYDLKIGIAMPGPFDYERGISLITGMNKYESLYLKDIGEYLSIKLNLAKQCFLFRNDAESFLHGEANCGSVKDVARSIGITLGTGLGSAVHENSLTSDANLGVSLFKDGIAEDYLSTRWFVRRYGELSGKLLADARPIFELSANDASAQLVIEEFASNLADFLNSFAGSFRPEAIVIGGNISRAHQLFLFKVQAKLVKLGCLVPVKTSSLWEDAAMIGMACYWQNLITEKLS